MTLLRCTLCWSLVAPAEGSCAGCGTVFSPEEIARAVEKVEEKEGEHGES